MTNPQSNPRRSRRRTARLLLCTASVSVTVAALGGIAHADGQAHHDLKCDHPCIESFADSDGDGFSDAYELLSGSNPLDAASRPSAKDTSRLFDDGQLARVRFSVDGNVLVTAAPGLLYDVDMTAQPDGTQLVSGTLGDPATGMAFAQNHYGIDAAGAGVDVKGLAASFRNPSGTESNPGSSTLTPPTEGPSLNGKIDNKRFADGEGEGETTTAPTEPSTTPAAEPATTPPAETPPATTGGGGSSGGEGAIEKEPKKWCNTGDPCEKETPKPDPTPAPKPETTPKPEKPWYEKAWESGKCSLTPGCKNLTDPDAGGGSGNSPVAAPANPVPIIIAPIDPVPDQEKPEIQAPTGPYQKNAPDPTVSDPNPEAPATSVAPGTPPKPSIAPVDPIKPEPGGGAPTGGGIPR